MRLTIVDNKNTFVFFFNTDGTTTCSDLFDRIREKYGEEPGLRILNMRTRGEIFDDPNINMNDLDIYDGDRIMVNTQSPRGGRAFPRNLEPMGRIVRLRNRWGPVAPGGAGAAGPAIGQRPPLPVKKSQAELAAEADARARAAAEAAAGAGAAGDFGVRARLLRGMEAARADAGAGAAGAGAAGAGAAAAGAALGNVQIRLLQNRQQAANAVYAALIQRQEDEAAEADRARLLELQQEEYGGAGAEPVGAREREAIALGRIRNDLRIREQARYAADYAKRNVNRAKAGLPLSENARRYLAERAPRGALAMQLQEEAGLDAGEIYQGHGPRMARYLAGRLARGLAPGGAGAGRARAAAWPHESAALMVRAEPGMQGLDEHLQGVDIDAQVAQLMRLEEERGGANDALAAAEVFRGAPPLAGRQPPAAAGQNPEVVRLDARIRELEGRRAERAARVNQQPAPPTPAGRVALAGLPDDVREAVPLEMIEYVAGVGFVDETLVERIRGARYLRGTAVVPFANGNGAAVPADPLVRQIVKQDLVKNNGKVSQRYRDLVKAEGECPICLENRPLFKVHAQHAGNGACQICILGNLDSKIENLEGVDGPADVKLPQPRAGLPEVAAAGADPDARICDLEDQTCNRATSWYDLYKISCTTPLVEGEVNSCERFKAAYRRFLDILNRKIERQREVVNEAFQRRAREDRNVNVGALDREIQQLRDQIQQIRDREAAARNARRQQLIAEHGRAQEAYRGQRAEYNRRAAQRRGIERGNFPRFGVNALKSHWEGELPKGICPYCITPIEISSACLTFHHVCRVHSGFDGVPEIIRQFPKVGAESCCCSVCGRPQGGEGGHQHYSPDGSRLGPQAGDAMQYFNPRGIAQLGCGGRGEFIARMIAMKNIIQRHVNQGVFDMTPEIRRELALAMRDAAIAYNAGRPVNGISVQQIIGMLQQADRTKNFNFLVVDMPELGPEPQPPQRPRELNQLALAAAAAGAPAAAAAVPAALAAAEADRDRELAQNVAQQLVLANRPHGLLELGLYLGDFLIEWGGHAFDRCLPRFLRRREGGTRRQKKGKGRKQTRKGRKGRKTRKANRA